MYLSRIEQFRLDCRNLFVSTTKRKNLMSRNTISFWLRSVINDAYEFAPDYNDDGSVVGVRAHKVQKFDASLLFRKSYAVQQVLKVGSWSFLMTFTSLYMRDFTQTHGHYLHLSFGGSSCSSLVPMACQYSKSCMGFL